MKLDKIDMKILHRLQKNSKVTNLKLSKEVGLSPAPTLERVKKLEKINLIQSYHATVNADQLGLKVMTFVLVNLKWEHKEAMNSFVNQIKNIAEIVECYVITGDSDFLMKVVCKDVTSYENLIFNKLSEITEIQRVKTLMTLSMVKNSKVLPFDYDREISI